METKSIGQEPNRVRLWCDETQARQQGSGPLNSSAFEEKLNQLSLSKAAIMSDITQEEIVEIVTNFLLNSPPGEFMEVVTGTASPLAHLAFMLLFSLPRNFGQKCLM